MHKAEKAYAMAGGALIRACLCVLLLLFGGCVYFSAHTLQGSCSNDHGSPIRNFCVVAPGVLWRGERPTRADAEWLLKNRVGSIVSLQLDDRRAFEAATPAKDLTYSMPYFQVSGFNPFQLLSSSRMDRHVAIFLAIMNAQPKPVYVHCRAGIDRTGVLAAAYSVLIDGATREQAIAELAHWHSPWFRLDAKYIRGLSETRQAEILRKARDFESRLRPSARIECANGRCAYVRTDPAASGGS